MSLCAICGLVLSHSDGGVCAHHPVAYGPDWAEGNRIMCAFFHRGIVPERVAEEPEPVYDMDF